MRPYYFQQKLSIYCTFVFSHRLYLHIPLWFCQSCLLCLLHFLRIRPFASSLAYGVYMYFTNLNLQHWCVSGNFSSMDAALKNVTARGNSYRFKEKTACYPFVIHSKTFSKPFKVIDNIVVRLWTLSRNIKHAEEIHNVRSLLYSRHYTNFKPFDLILTRAPVILLNIKWCLNSILLCLVHNQGPCYMHFWPLVTSLSIIIVTWILKLAMISL